MDIFSYVGESGSLKESYNAVRKLTQGEVPHC